MLSTQLRVFIFSLILAVASAWGAGKSSVLAMIEIHSLRPTQAVAGFDEVDRKARKISGLNKYERREYFIQNTVPIVIGPDSQFYMIDHHHFVLAAYQEGYDEVNFKIVADYSHLPDMDQFWKIMKLRKWVYLKNNGISISVEEIPRHIKRLRNDHYRSLAGQIRQGGGYDKTPVPFAEFYWADFFRERIPLKMLKNDRKKAFALAMDLAGSDAAKHLPGYHPPGLCIKFYGL